MRKLFLSMCFIFALATTTEANSNNYSDIGLSEVSLSDNIEKQVYSYMNSNYESYSVEEFNIICNVVAGIVAEVLEEYTNLSDDAIEAVEKAIKKVCEELIEEMQEN